MWEITGTSQDTQFLQKESQHWSQEALRVQVLLTEEGQPGLTLWPPVKGQMEVQGLWTTPLLH